MLNYCYDLVSEKSDKHLLETIIDGVKNNILTIVNYNDSTSFDKLNNLSDKTDNDKNTVFLTKLINTYSQETQYKISKIFYLTNTNGVLGKNKKTVSGYDNLDITCELEINKIKQKLLSYIDNSTGSFGTGGMGSKIISGLDCLKYGANGIYICNSKNGLKIDKRVTRVLKLGGEN